MLNNLHLGRGTTSGALTVYPIWHLPTAGQSVALAGAGNIAITEAEVQHVPTLRVTARGPSPVLLPGGDLLKGGLQNRIAARSVLLRPGVTTDIEVRCVEQQRWSGTETHAFAGLRCTTSVLGDLNQGSVWRNVTLESRRVGAAPQMDDLVPLPGQSGVLVGIAGGPTVLEVFADHELLLGAWDRIVESAARDARGRPAKPTPARRAREFIALVDTLKPKGEPASVGIGRAVTGVAGPLELRGIRDTHRLLHATVLNHAALQRAASN
jgi:hypothetical protein